MSSTSLPRTWNERERPSGASFAAPLAPKTLEETDVPLDDLLGLVLRLASTMSGLSTETVAERLCLPERLSSTLLETLHRENKLESLGSEGLLTYRYAITDLGREQARRSFEFCGHVGPAPVSLEDYRSRLEAQFERLPDVTPDDVASSLEELVLAEPTVEMIGLACASGRTLFVHGPPGNGKTAVGRMLHDALRGNLWIPHCIHLGGNVIRVFDPQVHVRVPVPAGAAATDARWVCIRRPFVVVGGELTMDSLELAYDPAQRCYEAPLHFKANGGTFLLDDFGCQRAEPDKLLGRWVYPLEHREDHLTLRSGQKVHVPFRQMLVVSTNHEPEELMGRAFLRRMGYRVFLGEPSTDVYREIFHRYAERCGGVVELEVLEGLIERAGREGRRLNGCEPRDLIERARDICRYRGHALRLDAEVMERAWTGYFGDPGRGPAEADGDAAGL